MEIEEFRAKIKPNDTLAVEGKEYIVKEVIRYKIDDGSIYFKCHLGGDYVIADDSDENIFIFVQPVTVPLKQPFPKNLILNNKKFEFLYTAHAVAEEVQGEEIFPKGYSEKYWDYKSDDGSYLSLGVSDSNNKRLDFCGKIVQPQDVDIK